MGQAKLLQGSRQPAIAAKRDDFQNILGIAALQHQLHKSPEGHFLPMEQFMRLSQHGQAIVNGMGSGKAPAFKPDAAQIRIALNHILHRVGHCASFRVRLGLPSIPQQRVPTQLRQSQGSPGAASAGHGHCAGACRSLRFITGRQRIAYPCHQKPHRSLSHCQRIHHHHVGIG